jgi:hypothetical protein
MVLKAILEEQQQIRESLSLIEQAQQARAESSSSAFGSTSTPVTIVGDMGEILA